MSFVSPNIFDFVARKNDEKYVHERVLVQLLRDKRFQDIFLKKVCNREDWKVIKVLEQPPIPDRKSSSGHGLADILLLATNDKEELLPIILELKTNTDASDSQLADYYYGVKKNSEYCKNTSPLLLYKTPDRREASSKALTSSKDPKKKLKRNEEYRTISYRELMRYIEVPKTSKINFYFVLSQYKKFVSEAEFCGFSSVEKTSENVKCLLKLISSISAALEEKNSSKFNSLFKIESKKDEEGQSYYYIDVSNECACLRFEFGSSSPGRDEDRDNFRILYGAKLDESSGYSWKTADYKSYLLDLKENKKTVYYTNNKGNLVPEEIKGLLTKGVKENHLNSAVWLFAQNLWWLTSEAVNKENAPYINEAAERIADFIFSDLGKIRPIE